MFNYSTWKEGEKLAKDYLIKNGYKILETNSKLAGAEVDIVALLKSKVLTGKLKSQLKSNLISKQYYSASVKNISDILVFVEVKARSTDKFGLPQEAVNSFKQNQIKKFAQIYICKNNWTGEVRFDVIAICFKNSNGEQEINHIKNAF